MASNGPPVVEHLLSRVRRWIIYLAGSSFWPLNNEHSDAERPPINQEEEELGIVGLDGMDGLQEAEILPHGGNRPGEGEENARPPIHPLQQLLQLHYGIEWEQQVHAVPFPVYYPVPYAVPFAVPHPAPYAYPYAFPNVAPHPFADPYAFPHAAPHPFADPYAFPHAAPHLFADPYAFPHAAPHAFADPYAFPHAAPHPFADPYDFPHAAAHAAPVFPDPEPHPVPHADPNGALEQLIAMYQQGPPEDDEDYDVFEVEDEDGTEIPDVSGVVGSVENIEPLSTEDSFEEFSFSGLCSSFSGAPESPSTSGLRSFTRRRREESDREEAAAKRPRWSDESKSD